MSLLKIKKAPFLREWQLLGNFNDWKSTLIKAPFDNLLSYYFEIEEVEEIETIEALKIDIKLGVLRIIETIDLTSEIELQNNGNIRYYVCGTNPIPLLEKGVYFLRFSSDYLVYESELFCIDGNVEIYKYLIDMVERKVQDENEFKILGV
jgi:hypothetical protein